MQNAACKVGFDLLLDVPFKTLPSLLGARALAPLARYSPQLGLVTAQQVWRVGQGPLATPYLLKGCAPKALLPKPTE